MTTEASRTTAIIEAIRGRLYNDDMLKDFAESLDVTLLGPLTPDTPVCDAVRQRFQSQPDHCARLIENVRSLVKPDIGSQLNAVTIHDSIPHGMMQPTGSGAIIVISHTLVSLIVSLSRILLNGIYPASQESVRAHQGEPDYLAKSQRISRDDAVERDSLSLGKLLADTIELGLVRVLPMSEIDSDSLASEYGDRIAETALQFIVNHEAAHFLQGHHESSRTRGRMFLGRFDGLLHAYSMEAEADKIAAQLLCEQVEDYNGSLAHCGAFVALRALSLLERGSQRHAPAHTHPPASERLLRIEGFLLAKAHLNHWNQLRHAIERRSWILEDYMTDHGLYMSPFEIMIRHLNGSDDSAYRKGIALLIYSLVFGDVESVARSLGILWADAVQALRDRLTIKGAPNAADRLIELMSRLSSQLAEKMSGKRILEHVERYKKEHASLHSLYSSYWFDIDRHCLLNAESPTI